MSARLVSSFFALVIFLAVWVPQAPAADEDSYVVVFKDSVAGPAAVAEAQAERHDGRVGFVYRYAMKGYSAVLPEDEVAALRRNPRVAFVVRDHRLVLTAQTIPTGVKRVFASTNPLTDIDGIDDERANVDVAVIDSGIDKTQKDLNVFKLTNCVPPLKEKEPAVEKCKDGEAPEDIDHGTPVASAIGAIDNAEGVVGVAPGARLWAAKVLTLDAKSEEFSSDSWVAAAVDWVTSHAAEIEVANMSVACLSKSGQECKAPATAKAISGSVEKGVAYVAGAGNQKIDAKLVAPANHPDVITVSGIADYDGIAGEKGKATAPCVAAGADDQSYSFSNFGSTIEVAAPAVCIRTLVSGGEALVEGTSIAAPQVAGAAAILASMSNPEDKEDVELIRKRIVEFGNKGWKDTSGDGVQEPLLDVSNEGMFNLNG